MSLCSLKEKGILTSASEDILEPDNGQKHPKNIDFDGSVLLPVRNTDCQTHLLFITFKKKGKNSAGNDHTIFWTPEICQKST